MVIARRVVLALLMVLVLVLYGPLQFITGPRVWRHWEPAGAERVLWIGNSHSAWHGVPRRAQKLTESTGGPPVFVRFLWQAQTLEEQLEDPVVQAALEEPWDRIVVQEQSYVSLYDLHGTLDRVADLQTSSGAEVVFYGVWPQGSKHRPALVPEQRRMDRWGCAIHDLPDVTFVPAGHAISAQRAAGDEVVGDDGNHLTAAGASVVARQIAHVLSDGRVTTEHESAATLCADLVRPVAPWSVSQLALEPEPTLIRGWGIRVGPWSAGIVWTRDGTLLIDPPAPDDPLGGRFREELEAAALTPTGIVFSRPQRVVVGYPDVPRRLLVAPEAKHDLDVLDRAGVFGGVAYQVRGSTRPHLSFPGHARWLDGCLLTEGDDIPWTEAGCGDLLQQVDPDDVRWTVENGYLQTSTFHHSRRIDQRLAGACLSYGPEATPEQVSLPASAEAPSFRQWCEHYRATVGGAR